MSIENKVLKLCLSFLQTDKDLRNDNFEGTTGPDVFRKFFLAFSEEMSIRRSSCGVEYFLSGANFLRIAGFNGGLDLIKSKIKS